VTSPSSPSPAGPAPDAVELPFGPVEPADEATHPPGPEPFWQESYYLDFAAADGSIGGYVRIGRYPNLGPDGAGVIWYWACVVGPDRSLVTVIDNAVPFPNAYDSLELRTDGLWADHHVETPLDHFSLGLEAFGVALDDPADTYRGMRGVRTPLGFDLEWETDGIPFRWPQGLDRYEIPCRVHGEILVGDERIEFEGPGQRDHSWGERDWWVRGWCWTAFRFDDGTRLHAVTTLPSEGFAIGYEQPPDGGLELITAFDAQPTLGVEAIPTSARLDVAGVEVTVEPLAWSPVLLVDPAGREARFPRAMARFTAADGRTGLGWIEFNQPPT
jgi:hypothetical protein